MNGLKLPSRLDPSCGGAPVVGEPVVFRHGSGREEAAVVINISKNGSYGIVVTDRSGFKRLIRHVRYSWHHSPKFENQINKLDCFK